jgi:hypothetical protein
VKILKWVIRSRKLKGRQYHDNTKKDKRMVHKKYIENGTLGRTNPSKTGVKLQKDKHELLQ